jgi:hypothetical protein
MTSGHAEFIASNLLIFERLEKTIETEVPKHINVRAITREEVITKTNSAEKEPNTRERR